MQNGSLTAQEYLDEKKTLFYYMPKLQENPFKSVIMFGYIKLQIGLTNYLRR